MPISWQSRASWARVSGASMVPVGLAGLAFSSLGSFVGILLGELRQPEDNIGAALLFWVDFAVLVIGGIAFYALSLSSVVVLLIGGASAVITGLGLLIILHRQRR